MKTLCEQAQLALDKAGFLTSAISNSFNDMVGALGGAKLDEPEAGLIKAALTNIANGPEQVLKTKEEKLLYRDTVQKTFDAVITFTRALKGSKNEACREIERKLFRIVFSPANGGAVVYPVYFMHDEFLNTTEPFSNFKSSTGSGKTRCAPFFFALKALQEGLKMPFFIMTQPGSAIIRDKMNDFREILGDSIELVDAVYDLEKKYGTRPEKPVVGLFTPHAVVRLLARASNRGRDIVSRTRFALDEIHERSVETDVMVALLAEQMVKNTFPFHLLMMSATPDPRVMGVFGHVHRFELKESQLFHIEDRRLEAPDFRSLDSLACKSALKILQEMADSSVEPGHILIFTSGNRRINQIIQQIGSSAEKQCDKAKTKVKVLKHLENYFSSRQLFYERVDEILAEDPDCDTTLYVLPIKYAGFVNRDQQEIGKHPIPGHPNIIKIIVATNSIESSITITGLAAVVDCGIRNEARYDKQRGMKNIVEGPISVQSQTQRRGRVGRVRDGICVQMTVKNHPPIELQPPSIQVEDISTTILNLRRIGIRLENIRNLPEPGVPRHEMRQYIKELVSLGALDQNGELTSEGRELAAFTCMTPFLASALVRTSQGYEDPRTASISGALLMLVMNTDNLISDPFTEGLQRHFCEESDLFTLADSLLEITTSPGAYRKKLGEFGFHVGNGVKVISTLEQIAGNLVDEEADARKAWNEVQTFLGKIDRLRFVQQILDHIGEQRPQWRDCRVAQYKTVVDCLNSPQYLYTGASILVEGGKGTCPDVFVRRRPGGKGFAAPGACFLMQIQRSPDGIFHGAMLHRDISRKELCHPVTMETTLGMNNDFVDPMLTAYLGNDHGLLPFRKTRTNVGSDIGGFLFFPDFWNKTVVLSYAPKKSDQKTQQRITQAISRIEMLMPFTPRCLLVNDDVLKTVVSVSSFGAQQVTTKVYLYTDPCPAYQIDKTTIDYMCAHIKELSSINADLVIAMTGEMFFCMDDNQDALNVPTTWESINSVFRAKDNGRCHMVVMSTDPIPNAKRMTWVDSRIAAEYSTGDALVHVANMICRRVVSCQHTHDEIFAAVNLGATCDNLPPLPRDVEDITDPVNRIFDRFSMFCIKGQLLVQNVGLKKLVIQGNVGNGPDRSSFAAMKRFLQNHKSVDVSRLEAAFPHAVSVSNANKELFELHQRSEQLNAQWNTGGNRNQIKAEQNQIKQNRQRLNTQKQEAKRILEQHGITSDEDIKSLAKAKCIAISAIPSMMFVEEGGHSYYQTTKQVSSCADVVGTLRRHGYVVAQVPLTNITITHLKASELAQEEFVRRVDAVCERFGAIVKRKGDYECNERHGSVLGCIKLQIYTCEFAIPLAGEIEKALVSGGRIPLSLPAKICPSCLRGRESVVDAIAAWSDLHHLGLQRTGNRFFGSAETIKKAMELLASKETRPLIPFKLHKIPGGVNLDLVNSTLRNKNRNLGRDVQWAFQRSMNAILVPEGVEEEVVRSFFDGITGKYGKAGESDLLFDWIGFCGEDALQSGRQLAVYAKDGTVTTHNFCVTCCFESIKFIVDRFYDQDNDEPRMYRLTESLEVVPPIQVLSTESDEWPVVPLGQMMMALTSEPLTECVAKIWFTAIVYQALHSAPQLEFCPAHPSLLLRNPNPGKRMKCSQRGCPFYLCQHCHNWHNQPCSKSKALPPGFRRCPGCKRIIEKIEACNHMTCKCGKHFCYYCEWGPADSSGPVYDHLRHEHGGCFNDPPDYKQLRGQSVSPDELNQFYQKYPKFKPQ